MGVWPKNNGRGLTTNAVLERALDLCNGLNSFWAPPNGFCLPAAITQNGPLTIDGVSQKAAQTSSSRT